MEVDANEGKLTVIGSRVKTLSLRNYFIRKSSAKDKFTLALMSVHSEDILRIGFSEWTTFNKCYSLISLLIRISHANNLFSENLKNKDEEQIIPQQNSTPTRTRPNALKIKTSNLQ